MTAIALAKTAALQSGTGKNTVTREEQFNQLIAVYMDDLYRYGYWLSGSHAVADDLVQETLVRAWKSMEKLNDTKAAKGWLLTILRRENARRFERKRPQESSIPTEELAANREDYDTSTEAFVLRQALERLPEEYREPLLMQVVFGYSQKEIAAHLGISVAGAGTRLFRAREKMRGLL
jgi:RNA polymerase sigma-70 factor (ECF subfamily)